MRNEIRLREYSSALVALTDAQVGFLTRFLADRLTVQPTVDPGRYQLKAGSYVGFVMLPGECTLIIEPKVPVPTLFAMLAQVYDPAREFLRDDPQGFTTVQDLFEFVVRIFANLVDDLIKRGVLHGYRPVIDERIAIRGKLLLAQTLRHRPGLHDRHYCAYNEFTTDIPENRILRSATFLLQPFRYRERELSARLRRISLDLSLVRVDREARRLFQQLEFHRLNEHYRPALLLARLLLDHLTFSGSKGDEMFLSYLVDMNWLFETYVTDVVQGFARHNELRLAAQEEHSLDVGHKVSLYPDMVLFDRDGPCLVLDAKYKLLAHREDIYQMVAYCHALQQQRAVLIHPSSESAPAGTVRIKGQPPITIHYLSLDLNGDPAQLKLHAPELELSLASVLLKARDDSQIDLLFQNV